MEMGREKGSGKGKRDGERNQDAGGKINVIFCVKEREQETNIGEGRDCILRE